MWILHDMFHAIGAAAGIYTTTIAITAFASVAAHSPHRRRDARETLKLLVPARRG